MKECSKCAALKPLSEFHTIRSDSKKLMSMCKACNCLRTKKWADNNTERKKAGLKTWKSRNKEHVKAWNKVWYQKNKERLSRTWGPYRQKNKDKIKDYLLNKNYGISLDTYNSLLLSQNNKCKGCSRDAAQFKRGLHVDHCHVSNKVRGLLCTSCNTALGSCKDNPLILLSLIDYLRVA